MTNQTTINPDVGGLSVDAVDVKPVDIDWRERLGDSLDGWRVIAPPVCDVCGKPADLSFECENKPRTFEEGDWCQDETCDGRYEADVNAQPMMNYYYPLPFDGDAQGASERIEDLPLVVVEFVDGSHCLALSGGGMDFSWEICEAYMRLGFLPPFHFCRLSAMADKPSHGGEWEYVERYGRAEYDRNRWIIEGCKRSASVMQEWAARRVRELVGMGA